MAVLGSVNIDGLSLSPAMRSDLSSGMSASAFNSKYAGGGFRPIALSRQVGPAPAAPVAAAPAAPRDTSNDELTASVNASNAAFQALIDKQNAEQKGAFDLYATTSSNQEKLPALYDRLSNELGIGDLSSMVKGYKDQILTVQQLLGNLPANIVDRNKGTLTTSAQSARQVAAEGDPLRSNLANLGYAMAPTAEALSGAQNTLGTMLNLNVQQQTKDLRPLELRISALGDKFGREITGFTTQKQDTLNALMDKIQRNRQLSDQEWQAAQDLAKNEADFEHQKQLITLQANSTARANAANGLTLPRSVATAPAAPTKSIADWYSLGSGGSAGISLGSLFGGSKIQLQGGGGLSLQGGSGGIRLQ